MDSYPHQFGLIIAAFAFLVALMSAARGIRARDDAARKRASFAAALVALAIGVLVILRAIFPIVGYALACAVLTGTQLFELLLDERARKRRVASLAPRPAAEAVPTLWVAIAVASVLMLAPYAILGEYRISALIVGLCALVIATIAWRIASAPVQLYGEDIRSERMRDRASRDQKTGVTSILAIGTVFVFISFTNAVLPAVSSLQQLLLPVSCALWIALAVWVIVHSLHLRRLSGLPS